jgi:hypothetical protein
MPRPAVIRRGGPGHSSPRTGWKPGLD